MSRLNGVIVILLFNSIATRGWQDEIRFVNVVFRHGNRAPHDPKTELYPNDPHLNNTFYPVGFGGLTNEGKRRSYKLGKLLRKRYDYLLGDVYVPEDIEARSTNVPRTKMSLQLVLAGLYPPTEMQKWNDYLDWQPIPTNYVPRELDDLFFPALACPKYVEELERVEASLEIKKAAQEFRPMLDKLSNLSGRAMTSIQDMWFLYHGLVAEASMNLTLPEWMREFFPDGYLLEATILEYHILSWNNLLKRLGGGSMLKRMIDDMMSVANASSKAPRKMNLFSGHELNVAAVLTTLDVYEPHVPEYTSAVIIELIRRRDLHFVKVIHYLGIPAKFVVKYIPECGRLCPLERFIELMREVTPLDIKIECKTNFTGRAFKRDLL